MLKFISKFVLNIFPSVAASVIGAYIVHNYINAKPAEPPPAATASAVTSKVDVAVGREPTIMLIPVSAKVAEAEAPVVARERAESDAIASTSDKTVTSRDKHSAVHVRNAHLLARTTGERLGVSHRSNRRLAETSAAQRERVQASNAATPATRSGPILMPAVDLVPDEQVAEATVQPRIAAMRSDPVRILPTASEMPLMKRLASFSNDVETKLVSQTLSTADDIVTAAKSAFHTVMPR